MTPPRIETLTEEEAVVVDAIRKAKEETARVARVSNDQVRQYLESVNYTLTGTLNEVQTHDRASVDLSRVERDLDEVQGIIYALLR